MNIEEEPLSTTGWVDTGGGTGAPPHVYEHLNATLQRRTTGKGQLDDTGSISRNANDNTDHICLHLATGACIVLASSGGWGKPESSFFKLFLYAPSTPAWDITFTVLGKHQINFDASKIGCDRYGDVMQAAEEKVTARIGARELYQFAPSPHFVDKPLPERPSLTKVVLAWLRWDPAQPATLL